MDIRIWYTIFFIWTLMEMFSKSIVVWLPFISLCGYSYLIGKFGFIKAKSKEIYVLNIGGG